MTTDRPHRFRLRRAGVLNVWQYDEQVFDIDGGRLLLRGTNGAGKSKTLEMLLPFALDGDKARLTASGRHHTSLVWLMLDGYEGSARTGYLWVEFERTDSHGERQWFTCGVGLRASQSARQAAAWFFTTGRRVGHDLQLDDGAGPLSRQRLQAVLENDGHVFESAPRYKEHVGRTLFGLDSARYDELLRLLYWLRQPQVGEDIDPARLAGQLAQALPQLDDEAIRSAGDTFDELTAFGEQVERKHRAATAVAEFAQVYAGYAAGRVAERAAILLDAHRELGRCATAVSAAGEELSSAEHKVARTAAALDDNETDTRSLDARERELLNGPEARSQRRLLTLRDLVKSRHDALDRARALRDTASNRANESSIVVDGGAHRLARQLQAERDRLAETAAAMSALGLHRGLPVTETAAVRDRADADKVAAATQGLGESLSAGLAAAGRLGAAVRVVQAACDEHTAAERAAQEAGRRESDAQQRAEAADQALDEGRAHATAIEEKLLTDLTAWVAAAPEGISVDLPELAESTLPRLAALGRTATTEASQVASLARAEASAEAGRLESQRQKLQALRDRTAAEADPLPPDPHWARDPRHNLPGAAFWRLVDFAADVDPATRAAVEAGLEASGLLDAWVRPDGSALDAGHRDVVLRADAPLGEPTLAQVLVPDVADDAAVAADVVQSLLRQVAWGRPDIAAVDADGGWWLAGLQGSATKPAAQYVGASARAAERARRLAELDEQLAANAEAATEAAQAASEAQRRMRALDTWVDAVPRHEPLLTAWAALEPLEGERERAHSAHRAVTQAALAARSRAAALHGELERLAAQHGLPTSAEGLAARRESLATLVSRLQAHEQHRNRVTDAVEQWLRDLDRHESDVAERDDREHDIARAFTEHKKVAAELAEAVAAEGAGVAELERRLDEVRRQLTAARDSRTALTRAHDTALKAHGAATAALAAVKERLLEARAPLVAAAAGFAAVAAVPGLLEATLEPDAVVDVRGRVESVTAALGGEEPAVGRAALAEARRLAGLAPARAVDDNAVLAMWQEVVSGPAADVEPRVVDEAGVLVAVGRDESGEHPVGMLASRLRAAVEADRALLTDRERHLFEDHVLGHLGHSLRERRREADELVRAMNDLLSTVSTSQGIRVRLQWKLRDDIAPEARRAVELLGERVEALLPDERVKLRECLHGLIEASREESPEDSYTEHLARALDYRQWFTFRVRYLRPEAGGNWMDLHRRSPLSQGEQKVVCYLPLFAAAAAHFSSVAGAAPDSPRLVLLDDAFPKIDARTHPLLFGLLVDFDLDFVVTSERLWGDHETVPSLAIYEALRDPMQRGIAQFHHRWDGRRLHAIGA